MWTNISHFILKHKTILVALLGIYTAFMAYHAKEVKLSHSFVQVVPNGDVDLEYFKEFRKRFGNDDNLLVIGLDGQNLLNVENFNRLAFFANEVAKLDGVNEVLTLPRMVVLQNDRLNKTFKPKALFERLPDDQQQLDSLLEIAFSTKIYQGRLFNDSTKALSMLISIDPEVLNSPDRNPMIDRLLELGSQFEEATGVEPHYAGLPYLRTMMSNKVYEQMKNLTGFSLLATAIILVIFFRSFSALFFPVVVIVVVVISTVGTISLLGYEITLLTGLIPPIIVVISVPNTIYLLNKYHQEFARTKDKARSVEYIVQKIGIVTLMTNTTTAIGFIVVAFADIPILSEFGIVSGINILMAFVATIILLPSLFLWLPAPKEKQIKHVRSKFTTGFTQLLERIVLKNRYWVYAFTAGVVIIFGIGFTQLKALTYMVDDLPENSPIKQHLAFFEKHFVGAMPLEVVIDTQKPKGSQDLENLKKIDQVATYLASLDYMGPPASMVEYIKAARQAFYNGNPDKFGFPTSFDRSMILMYLRRQAALDSSEVSSDLLNSFVDTSGRFVRLSYKLQDVGSEKVSKLLKEDIRPGLDSILAESEMEAKLTGTTLLFIKGNDYLINNLKTSLIIALAIIGFLMGALFGNFKMIIISLIPNLIPLLVTAGVMGYFGIPLKPSTALIFTIALGISVDDSIHFLAKYRQELKINSYHIPTAVRIAIQETGPSMMYTSIVLFFGFVIFAFSDFGGTVALGVLTSTTLLFAMVTNLAFLPCLLISFDTSSKDSKYFSNWIEHYEEFHTEEDDEEIDINQIRVDTKEEIDRSL